MARDEHVCRSPCSPRDDLAGIPVWPSTFRFECRVVRRLSQDGTLHIRGRAGELLVRKQCLKSSSSDSRWLIAMAATQKVILAGIFGIESSGVPVAGAAGS